MMTNAALELPVARQTSITTPAETGRFTLDGSEELEAHLVHACERVLAGVRRIIPSSKLEALLLGGGYGRGEGGVLRTEIGDQPYNDLEFYVCLRGNRFVNRRRYEHALHKLAEELSPVAGVEVEFKVFSLALLRRSSPGMFYHDLVMGHRWLWGDESLLTGCEHLRDARRLPPADATRLLMNRCTGLLFARQKLENEAFSLEDADFVGRNLAKAQLAFGDAVLTAFNQYHWSCRERHERLQALTASEYLPWLADVRRHHAEGVEFKLHPHRAHTARTALESRHEELTALGLQVWLWLENRRFGHLFDSAREYALSGLDKCPETNPWRNRLVNVNAFGPTALFRSGAARYPRATLFEALALFLWEPWNSEPTLMRHLQIKLRVRSTIADDLVGAYFALWRRFR